MPNLKEIERKTITGKKGLTVKSYRIVTKETYKNRKKGVSTGVPMTYDDAVKYAKEFDKYTGKKHVVAFRYAFGWRSGGIFEDGDDVKINNMVDDYDDEGNVDLFDEIYAIDIKVINF
jgi:hypothetical protein